MNRGFLWRIALSIVATISVIPLVIQNLSFTPPFTVDAVVGRGYVIHPIEHVAFPPELHSEDVLAPDQMTTEDRATILGASNPDKGLTATVVVHRGAEVIRAPITIVADDSPLQRANILPAALFTLSLLALSLVTLWRGRDWTAWGLTLFSMALCIKQFDVWPTPAILGFWISILSLLIVWLVAVPGLYIASESLVGPGLSRGTRRWFRFGFAALLGLQTVAQVSRRVATVYWGWTGWIDYNWALIPLSCLVFLAPLFLLIAGYRGVEAPQRLRARWLLWSTGLLGATVVAYAFISSANTYLRLLISILQGLSLFGYLYAVVRHRVVDVSFVIDRALVYGLTTSLVVGVFAIVENFIEQAAVGNDASFLLQAGTTLVLALVLNRVHRQVEEFVDRVFFRRQRRVAQDLRRFAHECAFIETPNRLLSLAAQQVERAIGSSVALYEAREEGYRRLLQGGDTTFPAAVEIDDLALVSLRATQAPIDLDQIHDSALGHEGCVLPMALRGTIIGAIVCLPRRGEQFAPDERAELAKLAHEVGVALFVLKARDQERFLAAVASGEMSNPEQKARLLLRTGTMSTEQGG